MSCLKGGCWTLFFLVNDSGLLHDFVESGRLQVEEVLEIHSHLVKVV